MKSVVARPCPDDGEFLSWLIVSVLLFELEGHTVLPVRVYLWLLAIILADLGIAAAALSSLFGTDAAPAGADHPVDQRP